MLKVCQLDKPMKLISKYSPHSLTTGNPYCVVTFIIQLSPPMLIALDSDVLTYRHIASKWHQFKTI
jgi:hypothetical protein